MELRIEHLCRLPQHRATVAGWIYDEFWADRERHSRESLEELLRLASDPSAIPLSLLALWGDTPVGNVNLVESDDDMRPHLRPWLAALVVVPAWRRRGVGSRLVESVRHEAARLGIAGVYLGTDQPDFYARLGATIHERAAEGFCILWLPSQEGVAEPS